MSLLTPKLVKYVKSEAKTLLMQNVSRIN